MDSHQSFTDPRYPDVELHVISPTRLRVKNGRKGRPVEIESAPYAHEMIALGFFSGLAYHE